MYTHICAQMHTFLIRCSRWIFTTWLLPLLRNFLRCSSAPGLVTSTSWSSIVSQPSSSEMYRLFWFIISLNFSTKLIPWCFRNHHTKPHKKHTHLLYCSSYCTLNTQGLQHDWLIMTYPGLILCSHSSAQMCKTIYVTCESSYTIKKVPVVVAMVTFCRGHKLSYIRCDNGLTELSTPTSSIISSALIMAVEGMRRDLVKLKPRLRSSIVLGMNLNLNALTIYNKWSLGMAGSCIHIYQQTCTRYLSHISSAFLPPTEWHFRAMLTINRMATINYSHFPEYQ